MDDTIGKRIQRVRIERSHTQVELAYRIRETLDTINKIESEKIEPDPVSYTHLTLPTTSRV